MGSQPLRTAKGQMEANLQREKAAAARSSEDYGVLGKKATPGSFSKCASQVSNSAR